MRHIRVGELKLALAIPKDLDEQLLAATGCSAAEVHRLLGRASIASFVGVALRLVVKDPPPAAELAAAIAQHGVRDVGQRLQRIYAPSGKRHIAEPEPELTVEIYCDRYIAGEGRDDPTMLEFQMSNGEAIEAEFQRRNEAALAAAREASDGATA